MTKASAGNISRICNSDLVSFGSDWPGVFIRGDEALSLTAAYVSLIGFRSTFSRMFLA